MKLGYLTFLLPLLLVLYNEPPYPQADRHTGELQEALEYVRQDFHQNLEALDDRLRTYRDLAANDRTPVADLRQVHLEARRAFKRTEWLLEYIEPGTVKRHINGAPLPKTEPSVPQVVVIKPNGLQTLDELVFADEIDRKKIQSLTRKLVKDYAQLMPQAQSVRLQHRHVFEAMHEEVVRLFTLGVTGFDTPASGAAMTEARVVLDQLRETYRPYGKLVLDLDLDLQGAVAGAMATGSAMLENADFDSFDRLDFLRTVVNPLTEGLPRAQALLSIESVADYAGLPRPVNASAPTIFDADFLNADYFANLSPGGDRDERIALGRDLFYDPILSNDLTKSCATCHRPELAFTDGQAKSMVRNAPTLVNSVYAEKYFYDFREEHLERQMQHVVVDTLEFASDFVTIVEKLAADDSYRTRFAAAYADQPAYALSKWSVSDAISHYVASLQGLNSDFDRYARGETEAIDENIRRGFNLFMGKAACGTCHFAPSFGGLVPPYYSESETEVLGVPATVAWKDAPLDPDLGRMASGRPRDEAYFQAFAFKTPTVRNVAMTAPYMHNGVYTDLHQVMDFYNRGGGAGIGINLDHQTLPPDPLGLAEDEIDDIIAFMESLTDYKDLVPGAASSARGRGQGR